ncbi:Doublecortin domain-containing protein 2 [Myotis davidii]|uniref:Doublecortin domain-containing protein 2 n=1 Tax=Myotis davidii TaxID=225400 RepID=L5MBJ7_MYODS|nr:Doublecortin domain-containing protein 2 [Myotis davidii]
MAVPIATRWQCPVPSAPPESHGPFSTAGVAAGAGCGQSCPQPPSCPGPPEAQASLGWWLPSHPGPPELRGPLQEDSCKNRASCSQSEAEKGASPPFSAASLPPVSAASGHFIGGRVARLDRLPEWADRALLLTPVAPSQVKPVIHSRINVSARFRKPLQEPCTIFLIANGDLISPASRLLIPRKALNQWDHVLQMVTEKITLRSGAVHRLYTLEGKLVESGTELENGQFYVAVGRDKFKKLPYSELLFDKSTMRRSYGQKASSLPPIVGSRKCKGSGNDRQSKSTVGSSDNSSPQPPKRKGKKEDVNLEKPTKGKQNLKLKNSPQPIPDSDEGIFKAGEERSETRGAAEVQEDEDTQVEIPVDQRPAEIVDEEEDGEKESKDAEEKEEFSGMNGEVEEEGAGEATAASEEAEEIPGHKEEQGRTTRVNGGTDEENGEEMDPVSNELQEAVDEETKSQGAGSEQEEVDLDPQRPPRPEVKITGPQENEDNEQNKDYAVVA